jgi:SAM-dependent methyltransferase
MYDYSIYQQQWKEKSGDYYRLLRPYLQDFLKTYEHSKILEIGSGSGEVAHLLPNNFEGQYFGVDIDPDAISFAKKRDFSKHIQFIVHDDRSVVYKNKFDLIIFSLSACEMEDETLIWYLSQLNTKKILLINPSTITQYYPTQIYKPFLSKLSSRLGYEPKWIQKSQIVTSHKSIRNIGKSPFSKATVVHRSIGDYMNILKKEGYCFEKYHDLKYSENTVKTAPVSKFEALVFCVDKNKIRTNT